MPGDDICAPHFCTIKSNIYYHKKVNEKVKIKIKANLTMRVKVKVV